MSLIFWKIVGFVVHLHGFLLAVMCVVLPVTLRPTNLKFAHVTANLATSKLQLETLMFGNSWLMIFLRFVVPEGYSKKKEFVSPTPAPKRAANQHASSKSKYLLLRRWKGWLLKGGWVRFCQLLPVVFAMPPTNDVSDATEKRCVWRGFQPFSSIFITYHETRRAPRNLRAVIGGQLWQCDALKTRNTTCPYCYARHAI